VKLPIRHSQIAWALAVFAVALAVSLAGLRNGFVQDDVALIVHNTRAHDLSRWVEILTSPYWPPPWKQDLYRPFTSLWLALQYQLGGGAPLVFRAFSYLLYAAVAVAVLVFTRRLLPQAIAVAVALLFAVHPVHVEAVALGVAQSELLVGLLAVAMAISYLGRRRSGAGIVRTRDWAVLAVLYALACFSKETGFVLPLLLVAVEGLLLDGAWWPRLRRLWPGYASLLAIGVLAFTARTAVLSHIATPGPADALAGLSAGGRALTMLRVVPTWARLLLWPAHLRADYSPQEIVASTGFGTEEALGLVLVMAVAVVFWFSRRRAPVVSLGLAWTAIGLLPVSNVLVPTGILVAERNLFVPSIGFLLALGGLCAAIWETRTRRFPAPTPTVVITCAVVALLVAAGLLRSAQRHGVWRDEDTFAIHDAADSPNSWRAQGSYADMLARLGDHDAAVERYRIAIALAPLEQVWQVRNSLAERYFANGEPGLAVEQLRQSLAVTPNQKQTWEYLIQGYLALGDFRAARVWADSALALGGSPELFGKLRAAADSAFQAMGAARVRPEPR
jgi:hypothetical protein